MVERSEIKPYKLSAGRTLDREVYSILHEWGFFRTQEGPRKMKRWSTHAGVALDLMWEITDPWLGVKGLWVKALVENGMWTVKIECHHPDSGYWYCEAQGHTLPEAFCRALVQREGDVDEDDFMETSHL